MSCWQLAVDIGITLVQAYKYIKSYGDIIIILIIIYPFSIILTISFLSIQIVNINKV